MGLNFVLKAIADDTRMKILTLLLRHNYCVRALAKKLELSEGAISQHLKVLRDAGLLTGTKKGYFMHYEVNRDVLHNLAGEIEALARVEKEKCKEENSECTSPSQKNCNEKKQDCSDEVKEFCHGKDHNEVDNNHGKHRHCKCHKSE